MILNIEEIKKGCEFAIGFSVSNNLGRRTFYTPCGNFAFTTNRPLDQSFWKGAGSLFLTRVIEGINIEFWQETQDRYYIESTIESIDIWDNDDKSITESFYYETFLEIDQAKEQAIKHILELL